MNAWRCWLASGAFCVLCACAGVAPRGMEPLPAPAIADQAPACRQYVAAWVGNFRGHVATLNRGQGLSQTPASDSPALHQARRALAVAGIDEAACHLPYCIIRPLGDGRLDSYCGYRERASQGDALYRWIPYR